MDTSLLFKWQVLLIPTHPQNVEPWLNYEACVAFSAIEALRRYCIISYRKNASKYVTLLLDK